MSICSPALACLLVLAAGCTCSGSVAAPPGARTPYRVVTVHPETHAEHRLLRDDHHFLSVIAVGGALAIRPHPTEDPDAWGSTLYLQPFVGTSPLHGAHVEELAAGSSGVLLRSSGEVSRGEAGDHGSWRAEVTFTFDPGKRRIAGRGTLHVALAGPLDAATGDLNLYRIASNYLVDVPLRSGRTGDTGDMSQVVVRGESFAWTWQPDRQPGFYPTDVTRELSVEVTGAYNDVDAAAQGHQPIAAASKPSLLVVLTAIPPTPPRLTFGAAFDQAKGQQFWEDNIGVAALLRAPLDGRELDFALRIEAWPGPPPGAGR